MGFKQIGGALAVSIFSLSAIATPAFQPTTLAEAATKVKLNKTECTLTVGETIKLKLKGAKAVKFVSSNKKVVKAYSSGKIKAIKAGTATISVYDEQDKVYKCKVTVKKKAEVKDYGDVDLEGMEIFIRDWWHSPIDSEDILEPSNEYEEALYKYRQEMMDKYNFKIREVSISDWGSSSNDFIDYVTNGGDDNNYVFTLYLDQNVTKALYSGMMYDLSTLDCLDFSEEKFTRNMLHQKFSIGSGIYAFNAGYANPRTGVYFNKQLLRNCGIDPDSIYDAQKNGTWTWEMFEELIDKCQQDLDGDGIDDIYGFTCNEVVMNNQAVLSNGGSYIGKNKKGEFTYNLESEETIEALQWCVDLYNKYEERELEGLNWDAYMEEWRQGKAAFMIEQEYIGTPQNMFEVTDFDMGFVMFPKGPKAKKYVSEFNDNLYVIPACYDAERAWKIAFAWNLYTNPVPGYEDYNEFLEEAKYGNFDRRAIKETLPMMMNSKYAVLTYSDMIDGIEIGPQLTWSIAPGFTGEVTELIDQIKDKWKEAIEEANAMMK